MKGTVVDFNAKKGDKISFEMISKIVDETESFVTAVLEVVDTQGYTVTGLVNGSIIKCSYVQLKAWEATFI
jgi:hypothetical protein